MFYQPSLDSFLRYSLLQQIPQYIICLTQADLGSRKAAAIIFGKEVKFNWTKTSETARVFPEDDKDLLKAHYFEGLQRCGNPDIVKLLGHALNSILLREQNKWTNYEDLVFENLTNNPTHERIFCSLVGLHSLTKLRQYDLEEEIKPIEDTCRRFFPTLLELTTTLAKDLNPVNALLAKEVMKIFYRTSRLNLNDFLRETAVSDAWMSVIDQLFIQSIIALRQLNESKVSEHVYHQSPYWNILKWVLLILKKYTQRYGNPDTEQEKYIPFAEHWSKQFSVIYWERLIQVINNRNVIKIPEKLLIYCISILFNLFDNDRVIAQHSESLESFLFDTIFDVIKFTKDDQELFQDNPIEYFRKNDENSPNFGPCGQALNIIGKSFKRQKYLKAFMKFVNSCLSTGTNPRNNQPVTVIDKEAFFHIIETHSMYIVKIKNCAAIISGLLLNYVLPELSSQHGFMRMRACKMVASYGSSILPTDLLKQLSESIVKCLKDLELPVRSCAAQALETILKKKELRDFFLPELKGLLTTYVLLINEFENDTLICSLKSIFETYSEVIGPYALDLA